MTSSKHLQLNGTRPEQCLLQGHAIRAVGKHGKYVCDHCGAEGYCPGCVLVVPVGAPILHCDQHTGKEKQTHE
jgi:hypothetical protein